MTNNFKAADLIGKELIVGNGVAKYIINSVEGDTWMCTFHREGVKDLVLPMKAASLLKMVEAKQVRWAEEPTDAKPETPKDEPTEAETEVELDDVEEVDAEEIEEPKAKRKSAKPKLRVVKIAKEKVREQPIEDEDEPETEEEPIEDEDEPETEAEEPKAKPKARKRAGRGKYIFSTYTTKRGKAGAKIEGFSSDEPAYLRARDLHALASRERVNGKRVYSLIFGPNFADAARQMCDALNDGAGVEELLDIVDVNYKSLEQKWADKKAEYAEKKAKREEERKAAKTAKAAAKGAKGEELYTEAQVKERIRNAFAMVAKALKINIDDLEPIIEAA